MMKLIEAEFADFRAKVIHRAAPAGQVRDMRSAFFGGAISVMNILFRKLSTGAAPQESDMEVLRSVMTEIEEYKKEVRAEAEAQAQSKEEQKGN